MHTTWNTATSVIRPHGRPASARLLSAADQRQAEATQRRRRARAILASLMMPSSSPTTHAQVSSQRGVDMGIAAHEPRPYGRSRAEPGRPAGHLGSLPRSAARGRLAMARSPDPSRDRSARNRCPPGRRDLYVGVLRSAWSIRRKRKPLRHLPRPSLMVQEIQGPIRPRRDGCFVQFTVCFRCQPSADGMTSGQAQEGAQR